MRSTRRLVAALAATALGWSTLSLVVLAPAAHADSGNRAEPHDPATYYASTVGLSGTALATELNSIIDGNAFLPYTAGSTDVWDAMDVLDQDPNDASKVIDVYSGDSLVLTNKCGSSCALDGWNREHTWSQSRGSFDTDPGPGTDLFHMRVSRGNTNSSRGNLDFDETVNSGGPVPGCPTVCTRDSDSFEPRESIKGDVARGLFYMDVRYNGDADDGFGVDLRMWDQVGNSSSQLGKLSTLVAWSLADPPDDRERWRNDKIDSDYQGNRNPFIDHPEWVCSIWGSSNPTACGAPPNVAPTTSPMTKSTPEDTATTVALAATDADGDTLTWSLDAADPAEHGTAGVTGSTLSYTPAANFNSTVGGTDVVGVKVDDGHGHVVPTTVTITVTAVNDAPTAQPLTASTPSATAKQITLAGSDVDGDALTYEIAGQPAHGNVSVSGNTATYTSAAGYTGPDSFTYTVRDTSAATSAPATVNITVTQQALPPVATPVTTSTDEDQAKTFTLTATDPNGDTLTYGISGQPAHGTVSVAGTSNQATYTPDANYNGPDSFTFTASDGSSTSTPATVAVTVTPVNDPPAVAATALSTTFGKPVTAALTTVDVDGDPVSIVAATNPANGSVTYAGKSVTYSPTRAGSDAFVVTVTDGNGGIATSQVGVDVAKAAPALKISSSGPLRSGRPGTVKVKLTGVAGVAPTGKVKLKVDGRTLTVIVKKGVATFRIAKLPVGTKLKVRATYAGDAQYAAGSARKTLTLK
jgi:endonuclease I